MVSTPEGKKCGMEPGTFGPLTMTNLPSSPKVLVSCKITAVRAASRGKKKRSPLRAVRSTTWRREHSEDSRHRSQRSHASTVAINVMIPPILCLRTI